MSVGINKVSEFDKQYMKRHKKNSTASTPIYYYVALAIFTALILSFCSYYYYFSDKAGANTYIASKNISTMTYRQVNTYIDHLSDLCLHLSNAKGTEPDKNLENICLKDLDFTVDKKPLDKQLHTLYSSWSRPLKAGLTRTEINFDYHINTEKLHQFTVAQSQKLAGYEPTKDAHINYDGKAWSVSEGKNGKEISYYTALEAIKTAVATGKDQYIEVKNEPTQAKFSTESAQRLLKQAQKLDSHKVIIEVANAPSDKDKEFSPTTEEKSVWLKVADNNSKNIKSFSTRDIEANKTKEQEYSLQIDQEKVKQYLVEKTKVFTSDPLDRKEYTDAQGKVLRTLSPGLDGVQVQGINEASEVIASNLLKKDVSAQLRLTPLPFQRIKQVVDPNSNYLPYEPASGEKWVDIDLTQQTITPYIGKAAQSDPMYMVSGDENFSPTITGVFKVYHKSALQDMVGAYYRTPDVHWASFFSGDFAIHGSSNWRNQWGPNVKDGSHGCINLPDEQAKLIYDFAPIGTTVVSHY